MLNLTLISPSYNQRDFVERMLKSVESQSMRPVEHLIFDAHSTDGTVDILKDYAGRHDFVSLYSGRDTGQTNAINLGFSEAKGDIIGWLNTDDFYPSETVLKTVMDAFAANPDVDMIYGKGRFIDEDGAFIKDAFINSDPNVLEDRLATSVGILQPASFMRRSVFEELGLLNEDLRYCMDYEYWIRIAKSGRKFLFLDEYLAEATLHNQSKTIGSRDLSLQETVEMVQTHYGYAPVEWLERLANAQLTGADGIIEWKGTETEAVQGRTADLMLAYNATPQSIKSLTAKKSEVHNGPTLLALQTALSLKDKVVVTAFDEKFYESGLTLISQLKEYAGQTVSIIIYDVGLLPTQRKLINNIEGVNILSLPREESDYFEGYFSHRSYGFKSFAAWQVSLLVKSESLVLWMDAGIAPIKEMNPIWNIIETQDVFFVDHDDKSFWPFYNISFVSPESALALSASNVELMAPHIRAGLFGFKAGGRYEKLIHEAYEYSLNSIILNGDKHPERTTSQSTHAASKLRASIDLDPNEIAQMSINSLRYAYGYYGHRHDQSIISVLASRYNAPIQSAKRFCFADDLSSNISKQNWEAGKADLNVTAGMEVPAHYLESGAICMQHRGTFLNYDNLYEQKKFQETSITSLPNSISESSAGNMSESKSVTNTKPANSINPKFAKELETIPADPGRTVLRPPLFSLVTPNYNTAEYIERTLESVLNQNYPNLQYVVIDGASTDGSQSIIQNYVDKLHHYISEPDNGHSDALNKGFNMVSGDIMGWINSDDILLPGSLNAIAEIFNKYPDVDWITGQPTVIDNDGAWRMYNLRKWSRFRFLNGNYRWLQQESTFWRRSLWEKAGGEINPDVELAVDFDLWVRFFRHAELYTYQLPLGCFRFRDDQRSNLYRDRYEEEARGIINKELNSLEGHYKDSLQIALPDEIFPMEYDESYYRSDYLSICDTPTITVEDVDKREEVSPETSATPTTKPPLRYDSMERLLETSDLKRFRGVNMGKRCFIMGNGPSLNKTDLINLTARSSLAATVYSFCLTA